MKLQHTAALLSGALAVLTLVAPVFAQSADQHPHSNDTSASADLGAELRHLMGKVAELEANAVAGQSGRGMALGRSSSRSADRRTAPSIGW